MIETRTGYSGAASAKHSKEANQGRLSLLNWLKKKLRWNKKRKKKDLEIYPLF